MRRLALLALVALAAFPLSAHDHGRGPRRVVVVEDGCRPWRRWDDDRWERRHAGWYRDGWYRRPVRYDDDACDGGLVVLGPLPPRPLDPPFRARVELRFR
jgi:hypothetical protein